MPAIPIEEKELDGKIGTLGEKISSLEGSVTGIKSKQKLLISLYLSILGGIVGAMFVKMFFFQ